MTNKGVYVCFSYVFYVDEISCLVAVFEDVGWFVVEYAACEDGGASGVGV